MLVAAPERRRHRRTYMMNEEPTMAQVTHIDVADPAGVTVFELPVPGGTEMVRGRLIGFASSHRDEHTHPGYEHAPPLGPDTQRRRHCNACRWFEVRIIRDEDGSYVVHTQGPSTIPGDIVLCRLARTESPYEVVELLTVRRDGYASLPGHSSRALAQAAMVDPGVATAYVNRAVA